MTCPYDRQLARALATVWITADDDLRDHIRDLWPKRAALADRTVRLLCRGALQIGPQGRSRR